MADDLITGAQSTTTQRLSSDEQMKANREKFKDKFTSDGTDELVNSQTFLNLLVAEMTNQDPLEPTSNTEFITQMAQFSQLQYAKDSSTYALSNYASNLVGKVATVAKMDGKELVKKTGIVTDIKKNGESYTITVDGEDFDISKIISVSDSNTSSSIQGSNIFADMISRASLMIGMKASVKYPSGAEGEPDNYMSGIITSIKVKDGKIKATISGEDFDLSQIVQVTTPYGDDVGTTTQPDDTVTPPDDTVTQPDETENTEQNEQIEQAERTAQMYAERSDGELTPDDEIEQDLEDLEDIAEV